MRSIFFVRFLRMSMVVRTRVFLLMFLGWLGIVLGRLLGFL